MRRWTRLAVTWARCAVAVRALPGLTVGLALGAALPPAAQAAGNLLLMEAPPSQTAWSAGLSVWRLPQDPGARRHDTVVLPALDWQHPNGLFVSTDTGVGWNLSSVPTVQAGLRLWPQFGRSRKDAPPGIEPIGLRIQPEAFANVQLGSVLLLQGGLLVGAGRDRDGVQLELGATSGIPVGDDLIGIGLSATWANKAFRNDYFGVSEAEGRASGLPATAFDGGRLDASLTLSAEHRFGSHWRLSGQWVRARLSGSIARSPLVRSRRQDLGSLTLWRSF
jgi:outer membrane scaffolding protein for murein synthesis (MipA/OmpV family)